MAKCIKCRRAPAEYFVGLDGKPTKHGKCRDCHERAVHESCRYSAREEKRDKDEESLTYQSDFPEQE